MAASSLEENSRSREMKRMVAQESTAQKDEEIIISIVKEMTESMTGAQSTRHWAEDALWFDIPPFASRGIQPALKFFGWVFGNFQSCKVDIVETDVVVNGDMGLVLHSSKGARNFERALGQSPMQYLTECG
jgi:ketosteroid isomerase-like protein